MAYLGGLFKGVGDEIFAAANLQFMFWVALIWIGLSGLLCELGRRNGFETSEPGYEVVGLVFIFENC